MNRKALHDLLDRYTANQCSAEERMLVEHWYELIGEHRSISLTGDEEEELENKIWETLRPSGLRTRILRPLWRRMARALATAAAIALVGYYWIHTSGESVNTATILVTATEQDKWKMVVNKTDSAQPIRLPDSSLIVLAPHSQLAVSTAFNASNRNIKLLGKATFDIAKNPDLPFMLFCGDMVTKVLGTRFEVVASSITQPMEVTVKSGKVTLYRTQGSSNNGMPGSNGVILTPNQKATYYPENHQFVAGLAEKPELIKQPSKAGENKAFVFEETPLTEVIQRIHEAYGVEIELEQESIAQCPFTGKLTKQDLYTKLELLCGSINGSYEVRGTKILVMGKGCP